MNILVINGSPKGERSNTLRLTNAFVDGMTAAAAADVRRIDVGKLDLSPCRGCFACWNRTPGQCVIRDDMAGVIENLLWADVTVWSFPLYYFGVPGPLKTLIDRQLPMNLPFMAGCGEAGGHPSRYDMTGKRHVLISTCGFHTPAGNYDAVTAQFDRMLGRGNYASILCGEGELFRVRELRARTDEYLALVRRAGREFASGSIAKATMDALAVPLYPREAFERMADASWGVSRDSGETGGARGEVFAFTEQMAALYNPAAWPGHDVILDMDYTDVGRRVRVILGKDKSRTTDPDDAPATTTIRTPYSVWRAIAAGEITGPEAMMQKKYSVEGDFSLMLRWDEFFGASAAPAPDAQNPPRPKRADMMLMLAPFIVFFAAAPVSPAYGPLAALAVCLLVPLLALRFRATAYDAISPAVVGALSIAMLLGLPELAAVPLSYLAFGLMWGISALLPVPLSAHYSQDDYGGAQALSNPLFMRTNRILTACWGALYLLTPLWTLAMMRTSLGAYSGLVNSILPALMGVFTAWFQRWYPAHVARG